MLGEEEGGDEHDGTMRNGRFYGPSASSAMSSGARMSRLLQNVSLLASSLPGRSGGERASPSRRVQIASQPTSSSSSSSPVPRHRHWSLSSCSSRTPSTISSIPTPPSHPSSNPLKHSALRSNTTSPSASPICSRHPRRIRNRTRQRPISPGEASHSRHEEQSRRALLEGDRVSFLSVFSRLLVPAEPNSLSARWTAWPF